MLGAKESNALAYQKIIGLVASNFKSLNDDFTKIKLKFEYNFQKKAKFFLLFCQNGNYCLRYNF